MLRRTVVLSCLALSTALAHAEVAPFGLAVGSATIRDVHAQLGSDTRLEDNGFNKWSDGPMLLSNGTGLGIEGLQNALFIFDTKETLVGVVLTLPKSRFDAITAHLKSKYKLVSSQIPPVGNKSATFREDAITIETVAPHLSFEMEVRYFHKTFTQAYTQRSQEEKTRKQQVEREKF